LKFINKLNQIKLKNRIHDIDINNAIELIKKRIKKLYGAIKIKISFIGGEEEEKLLFRYIKQK
jgi:hypothetical protein